jgi:hypothetical protein
MAHHSSGAERFRELAGGDAYRAWLISCNQAPIVYHSSGMHWKRLRVLGRRIIGFLASQRLAIVASEARGLRRQPAFPRYDRKSKASIKAWMADRSRP